MKTLNNDPIVAPPPDTRRIRVARLLKRFNTHHTPTGYGAGQRFTIEEIADKVIAEVLK